jgi:hypothetical protein
MSPGFQARRASTAHHSMWGRAVRAGRGRRCSQLHRPVPDGRRHPPPAPPSPPNPAGGTWPSGPCPQPPTPWPAIPSSASSAPGPWPATSTSPATRAPRWPSSAACSYGCSASSADARAPPRVGQAAGKNGHGPGGTTGTTPRSSLTVLPLVLMAPEEDRNKTSFLRVAVGTVGPRCLLG